jgi:hypothetical protein
MFMNINDRAEMLSGIARQASNVDKQISKPSIDRQAWSDLVRLYPDKWIIYTNQETVDDERMFLCTVLSVCTNNERMSELKRLIPQYKNIGSMRTTDDFNGLIG